MVSVPGDWRHIANGFEIPTDSYSDQPYIVKTDDGAWLCVLTTGAGREGASGQHIITTRSLDRGKSWSPPVALEPADGPEASYAVLLKVPTGRIYCLYNHNTDNIREVSGDPVSAPDMVFRRVDSLGHYVFRYSDDGGRSWSPERYDIPVREFDIDRQNVYAGAIRFFWNVGRPLVRPDGAFCSLHKVGNFGEGFFVRSEGVLIRSVNILTENDPNAVEWETLPDGDVGLRTPTGGGPIAEEQSYTSLSDGSLYAVYRTVDGHPTYSISRDGGHTWADPEYLRFSDGRLVKHPRAANFIWRCENGKYLYWFHHHGGRFIVDGRSRYGGGFPYENRNPVWLSVGEEVETRKGLSIRWSEPEIVLYDDDPMIRMSYPDLVEDDGYYLTETQKDIARVHRIDDGFLEVLFSQFDREELSTEDCVLEWIRETRTTEEVSIPMPELPVFRERDPSRADHGSRDNRAGISLEIWFRLDELTPGQILVDWTDDSERGILVQTGCQKSVQILYGDGQTRGSWATDAASVHENTLHHMVCVFDGGPRIVTVVLDGRVQDGGDSRQFGWGRFSPYLAGLAGDQQVVVAKDLQGVVHTLRIYRRALMHTECIGNFRAGVDAYIDVADVEEI